MTFADFLSNLDAREGAIKDFIDEYEDARILEICASFDDVELYLLNIGARGAIIDGAKSAWEMYIAAKDAPVTTPATLAPQVRKRKIREPMVRVALEIPMSLCERLDAASAHMARSEFIRQAIDNELLRHAAT